jgi:hypothetical protein
MENILIPFGKYKGQPLEVMAQDQQYMEWIQQQGWLAEKYPQINTLIINNFKEPSETPDHNKIQGMFLDMDFISKLVVLYLNKINSKAVIKKISPPKFEIDGIDASFTVTYYNNVDIFFRIEIKPGLGDDYPVILRQIRGLKGFSIERYFANILLIDNYNGVGISQEQLIKLFNSMGIMIIFLHEI